MYLATMFGISETTAIRYATNARELLYQPPAQRVDGTTAGTGTG
ncbi:hypothetical protein ACQP0I_03975 [Micromonospora carbonacea]